jgi:acetylornithine deacetylase
VSHKGFTIFELEVTGKEAHGSLPEEGIDAIIPLGAALEELTRIQADLTRAEGDALLGRASLHACTIEGGTEMSTIPGRARLQWERRTLPGESSGVLDLELQRVIEAVENVPGNHQVRGQEGLARPPYVVPPQADIVEGLRRALPQAKLVGFPFWADSALTGQAGIPSVLFGPTGHGAHAVDEWISLKSLVRVFEALKRLIMDRTLDGE